MADFNQHGLVTTLHDLGTADEEQLEALLEQATQQYKATPSNKCTVRFSAAECGRRIWRSWCLAQVDW